MSATKWLVVGAVVAALASGCGEGPKQVATPVDASEAHDVAPTSDAAAPSIELRNGVGASIKLGDLIITVDQPHARLSVSTTAGEMLYAGYGSNVGSPYAEPPDRVGASFRHAEASYQFQYGAFRIEETGGQPWRAVASFGPPEAKDGVVTFPLLAADGSQLGSGSAWFADFGEVVLEVTAADPQLNRASLALSCWPDEHFLGLGGQSFDVDHRGQVVPLWVEEDGISKNPTDAYASDWFLVGRRHSTHTPMPIYLSSRNYALMLDTPARAVFDLCAGAEEAVRIENWQGKATLRIFHGDTLLQTLERLTARLGRPQVPPAFAFAPWLDALYGSANVRRVAEKLRAEDVPSAVIWTEDWRGGSGSASDYTLDEDWNLDTKLYPDFPQLAADLHDLGFKFLTYNNTFITSDADIYAEAVAKGYTIRKADGAAYTFGSAKFVPTTLLDTSNPAAVAWAKGVYGKGFDQGADGWMADFCEWLPHDARLFSATYAGAAGGGGLGVDAHQRYPVDCIRLNHELFTDRFAQDGVERLFFVRSAWLGAQPLVSVVWAGDQQTDWSEGDGLPSVVPIGLGLGVTGFPFYGHDIGGYASILTEATTKELWFRWVTLGALSPVMRTHHGKSAGDNWSWERDAESTAHFRRWATLHMRLLPYWLHHAQVASQTGRPLMQPLALQWPGFEPGWTAKDQYLLGDRLVVAPVLTQGATGRKVQLPPGRWYRFADAPDAPPALPLDVTPGQVLEVAAAVAEIPVFVPAGTVLVLLPPGVDTPVAAKTAGVQTLAATGDTREVWLWPAGDGSFAEAGAGEVTWQAKGWQGPAKTVTWQGQPLAPKDGAYTVEGQGELVVDGVARLLVGRAGKTVVRLR